MAEDQKFRSDLFFRLNVLPIYVLPCASERPEDIPRLIRHFAEEFSYRMNKTTARTLTQTTAAEG